MARKLKEDCYSLIKQVPFTLEMIYCNTLEIFLQNGLFVYTLYSFASQQAKQVQFRVGVLF